MYELMLVPSVADAADAGAPIAFENKISFAPLSEGSTKITPLGSVVVLSIDVDALAKFVGVSNTI